MINIGTSGYNYSSWRGDFYPKDLPQKKWLSYYCTKFDTVEINNSFYITIQKKTYSAWDEQTPSDFKFVIKGHRFITQYKKLVDVKESVGLFFENARQLGKKVKVILWQFPKNFSFNETNFERLKNFITLISKDYKHAFEFREEGWFIKDVISLLEDYNSTIVISESSVFPKDELPGNSFVYIRFHGPARLYSSGYSDRQLLQWAKKILNYSKTKDVYVFFNNDNGGFATKNALTLKELVSK